jgi:hypothetical protein
VLPVQLLDPENENEEIPEEVDTEELILKLNRYEGILTIRQTMLKSNITY